jgi:hypothetical protein
MTKKRQSTQEWWNNRIREDREQKLKRLEIHFGEVHFAGFEPLYTKYETFVIYTDEISHEDMRVLRNNRLEIQHINYSNGKLVITVTREGTQD